MSQFDEMIPEFVAESQDLLPEVEQGLLALEDDPDSVDQETVNTIFRAIHSIKGGASFVGLHQLERLAHKMEDLLNLIRNQDVAPTPQVSSELLTSLDALTEMLENVEDSGAYEIEGRLASLQAIIDGQASEEVKEAIATPAVSPQEDLASFEVDTYTLDQAFAHGFVYFLRFDLMGMEEQGLSAFDLTRELLSMGEILSASVQAVPAEDDPLEAASLVLGVLFASIMEEEFLKLGLSAEHSRLDSLSREDFPATAPSAVEEEVLAPPPMEPPPQAEAPPPETPPAPPSQPETPPPEPAPLAEDVAQRLRLAQPGEYLTFPLAGEEYAIETDQVQEIISHQHISRLPRVPDFVKGVINLRGMVVPVIDLRQKLGFEIREYNQFTVIIVINVADKTTGLIVDSVSDVHDLTTEGIQPPPELARSAISEYIKGVGKQEDRFLIMLDLDRLLKRHELGPL